MQVTLVTALCELQSQALYCMSFYIFCLQLLHVTPVTTPWEETRPASRARMVMNVPPRVRALSSVLRATTPPTPAPPARRVTQDITVRLLECPSPYPARRDTIRKTRHKRRVQSVLKVTNI